VKQNADNASKAALLRLNTAAKAVPTAKEFEDLIQDSVKKVEDGSAPVAQSAHRPALHVRAA
jgi:hypothetical protein